MPVDVKAVQVKRVRVFQYIALDDRTRLRVLRLYPDRTSTRASTFLTSSASSH
jgi:hypothetical protein